ncbi:hypothetical protein J7M28_03915 [bacterium]|nr:hypothetical protein [bacterium]
MNKCVICEQRRGKRLCPLKNSMICSQCCGLVQTEGNCPDDCPFLTESKVFASEKQDEREQQLGERFKRSFDGENPDAIATFEAVSKPLNDLLIERSKEDEHLEDKDLVEAMDDLIKILKMGSGALVVAPDDVKLNRAGNLLPLMKEKIDSLDADPPVEDYLIVPCLEILRGLVSLSANKDDPKAFLNILIEQAKKEESPGGEDEVAPVGDVVSVDLDAAASAAVAEVSEEKPADEALDLFEEGVAEEAEKLPDAEAKAAAEDSQEAQKGSASGLFEEEPS